LQFVQLWQGNLDGALPTLLADDLNWLGDVVFDPVDKHVYVASMGDSKIIRMNADGTERKDFLVDIPRPSRMFLDAKDRKLYWASNNLPRIDCVKLDGSGREAVLENMPGVAFGFGVDPVEKKIYWIAQRGALFCAKLDGSERLQLLGELNNPDGLAIDTENRKLYWAEKGKISQANLDGSSPEALVSDKTDLYSSLEILPPESESR
jgi:sugar lactone lactonase YvrE